ncbi:MAG: hypothetical protein H0W30_19640 [Gemmatimonadaceae bacterium]|nr:hypothetical protein [Gemmatimonadaceae bacterium]
MSSLGLFHMQRHVLGAHSSTDLGSSRGGEAGESAVRTAVHPTGYNDADARAE